MLANKWSAALLQPIWNGQASIFMLHRELHLSHAPDGTNLSSIAESIHALRSAGAHLVSLKYLFDCAAQGKQPPPGCVAFTIDDGYRDQGRLAREFLRQDCPVTIFLVSGFIDRLLWPWDEQLAYVLQATQTRTLEIANAGLSYKLDSPSSRNVAIDAIQKHCKTLPWEAAKSLLLDIQAQAGVILPTTAPAGHEPLNWEEIRNLESAGVDFGPHSVTHRVASQLSDIEARYEITESWMRLKTELQNPIPIYAWPTGRTADFLARDMQMAQELGLMGAVSTNDGYGNFSYPQKSPSQLFCISRFAFAQEVDINVQYGTAIEQLKIRLRTATA